MGGGGGANRSSVVFKPQRLFQSLSTINLVLLTESSTITYGVPKPNW